MVLKVPFPHTASMTLGRFVHTSVIKVNWSEINSTKSPVFSLIISQAATKRSRIAKVCPSIVTTASLYLNKAATVPNITVAIKFHGEIRAFNPIKKVLALAAPRNRAPR